MNIVYAANENFAKHLGVSLYSLYERNRYEKEIRVFIISMGIGEDSLGKLENIAKKFGRKIEIIDFNNIKSRFDYGVKTGSFDISIMARLFVGELLPKDVKRVLYLDCDTVVLHSLKGLYNTALKNNVIGAVEEPTVPERVRYEIRLDAEASYVNSGVLLIDLRAWRDENIGEKIIRYYQSIQNRSLFGDQDAINGVLRWRIKKLPPKYNFFSNYKYFSYKAFIKVYRTKLSYTEREFKEAKKRPVIVHFAGDERPWRRGNFNPYKRAYYYFKKKTDFKNEEAEKGKERYLLLYHLMNLFTVVCPKGRKMISDFYTNKAYKKILKAD
jgi:glycosyltransferase, family 8